MSPIPDRDDPTERQIAALVEFMDRVPMFQAVASDNPDERRLWRACELYRWSDTGMPEGLACKIAIFEGYARHCGFRVDTPRIPGLVYPAWGAF